MPLQATSGAASQDGFGGNGVPVIPNYIEEVFSTYLYTGTNAQQTITNGIDLSTKGGLIWAKSRNNSTSHKLFDSAQAGTATDWDYSLTSSSTSASTYYAQVPILAQTTGFRINSPDSASINESGYTYASWTFRKQPKFFDIVTYTGNAANRTIAHNLGSVPGCIIVKRTDDTSFWAVYHKDLGVDQGYVGKDFHIFLNSTNAQDGISAYWNQTAPTSTVFSLGASSQVNANGGTYVAYLFAHNAGGFGLTGTDNVISCGSFTTDGSGNATISLGYEPQWVMYKRSSGVEGWRIVDNMRGFTVTESQGLAPNSSSAEFSAGSATYPFKPTATGFQSVEAVSASSTYIYIAIRRGPMKVPTVGTSVFALGGSAVTGSSTLTTSFAVDAFIQNSLTSSAANSRFASRLQGSDKRLVTSNTDAEAADNGDSQFNGASYTVVGAGGGVVFGFGRAPSFFDEVCYTGNGTFDGSYNVNHNLGAVPEFIIAKRRDSTNNWNCYHSGLISATYQIRLNLTAGQQNTGQSWGPTSTTFKPQYAGNADNSSNQSGGTYVAYLFATCAGVSKVGSYTGNGSTQTIDCGFTGGARFVLIKRIDVGENGDWYVYDTARGMTVLTDPYLLLNSTAAQVATLGSVTTVSTGFALDSTILAAINVSAASYIFLAVA